VVRATKAVRALGAIEEPTALSALARLVRIEELDPAIRKAALTAISGQHSPAATQVLQDLASSSGSWAEDAKKALAKRSPQS